jgi:hypothetical protein
LTLNVGKRRSLLGGLAATIAVTGSVLSSAPAVAAPPDPTATNIPSLAWRGERVRLVACDASLAGASDVGLAVVDWSGDPLRTPALVPGSVSLFAGSGGQSCAAGSFLTQGAGMAQIRLIGTDGTGRAVYSRDYLSGWMNIETPSISGGGDFTAGGKSGEIIATIKGDMPMNGFGGIAGSVTLPDDWATLAQGLATDSNPADLSPWKLWDIHDDQSDDEGHFGTDCDPQRTDGIDAVDNCAGGLSFSTVFGLSSSAPVGPFDPMRPETLLANGRVDAGDAPMPAARIDFTIAPNSGNAGDTTGIGSFTGADKQADYSRDGTGADDPHNLYAPFSSAYIPATTAPVAEASGVDGPNHGGGASGFLVNGEYRFWDIPEAGHLVTALGGNTDCLLSGDTMRQLPSGDQTVAVYSDEHGEARTVFNPGTGAFYDALGNKNHNGGCDLAGVDVLGTASINVIARYPDAPQFRDPRDQASTSVTATVHSLFAKTLAAYSKGTGDDNAVARIVVAHAQDVTGAPMSGERVCAMPSDEANGMRVFTGVTGDDTTPINLAGSHQVKDPFGANRACAVTNDDGNAGFELFHSGTGTVGVIAEFVDEGLLRHIDVDFGHEVTPPPPPGPVPGGDTQIINQIHNTYNSSTTTNGSGSTNGGTKLPPVVQTPKVKMTLAKATLVRKPGKTPYLLVRVNGAAGEKAAIKVKLFKSGHKAAGSFTRSIAVNKVVKVTSPKLTKLIRSVHVSL